MREIRRCEEKGGHMRSKHLSVLAVEDGQERYRKRKRVKENEKKTSKQKTMEKTEVLRASVSSTRANAATEKFGDGNTFSGVVVQPRVPDNRLGLETSQNADRASAHSNLKLKLTVGGVPVELEGQLELVMLALKRLT